MDHTPGIEAVTGSLGMGLSIGLGMALGFRLDGRPSRVYVIMGDGELSEGQIWEAAMAAAAFKVDNLTGFVDLNRIQATGPTSEIFDIPEIEGKWAAFGWEVVRIDGHDVGQVLAALDTARATRGRPTVIVAETVKGKGFSFAENNPAFHNGALTAEQHATALAELEARRAEIG
jgi:transketolase